ncbi:MAG TPA: hypothetical protein VEU97_03120 [Ktedonobacteraceae bacterium]|nr:hypothetical protein [Ktedonobacteraceae bacterium]
MDDQGRKGYQGEEHFYNPEKLQPSKSFWRSHPWPIITSVALVLMIIFASTTIFLLTRPPQSPPDNAHPAQVSTSASTQISSTTAPVTSTPGATATVVPTTAATPTSQATPGLPCSVDVSTWTGGSPDWVVHNGVLFNDGSSGSNNGPTIIAPCQPGTTNYAVEAKIQVINQSYGCFGIVFRGSSTQDGWQGYKADVCGLNTAYISVYGDGNALTQAPFTPGTTAHIYRAEVKDNTIKFFIDGNLVDTTTDNRLLTTETGEGVGLYSQNIQLQVTSFQVKALS